MFRLPVLNAELGWNSINVIYVWSGLLQGLFPLSLIDRPGDNSVKLSLGNLSFYIMTVAAIVKGVHCYSCEC